MKNRVFVHLASLKIDKDAARRFVKGALANPGGLFENSLRACSYELGLINSLFI